MTLEATVKELYMKLIGKGYTHTVQMPGGPARRTVIIVKGDIDDQKKSSS